MPAFTSLPIDYSSVSMIDRSQFLSPAVLCVS